MPFTALVINPWVTDFKLYDEWMHPLGLYFLISLLEKNGVTAHYFNCLRGSTDLTAKKFNTGAFQHREIEKPLLYRHIPRKYKLYGNTEKELRSFLLQSPDPDVIFIGTMMTHWLPGVAETIRIIRTVHPSKPILIGGVAARLMPETVYKIADPGVTFCGVLDVMGSLHLHSALPGLIAEDPPSLLGGFGKIGKQRHGPILLTLGCPMACGFCASSVLQGKFRLRPQDRVIEEVLCLAQSGVKDFAFFDDALLYRAEEGVLPFLGRLSTEAGGLRFHAPNGLHLRYITGRTAEALKSNGFSTLRFGYENGASVYGDYTSRKADRKELAGKIALLENAGFAGHEIGVYVMAGLPGQSPEQVREELRFVASCGAKVKPVFLSPVPGTALFEVYANEFPQMRNDPLWHNDTFFVTKLPGWSWDEMETIRVCAKELNNHEAGLAGAKTLPTARSSSTPRS